jgi:thymidylate kinase
VKPAAARLVSMDGVNGTALKTAARSFVAEHRRERAGLSQWGASGIFDELTMADSDAGTASPRTLLLLYAADLAFRLRWQIEPALEEGRTVVAAPYVQTAIAFGRATGLEQDWLSNLFRFAPAPAVHLTVEAAPARRQADRTGFLELACQLVAGRPGMTRQPVMTAARRQLRQRSGHAWARPDELIRAGRVRLSLRD